MEFDEEMDGRIAQDRPGSHTRIDNKNSQKSQPGSIQSMQ